MNLRFKVTRFVLPVLGVCLVIGLFLANKAERYALPSKNRQGQSKLPLHRKRKMSRTPERELQQLRKVPSYFLLTKLIDSMRQGLKGFKRYSFYGLKRIYKCGRYLPEEKMRVSIDRETGSAHIVWLDKRKQRQEVWWPVGESDRRLIARGPGWRHIFEVKIDPLSKMAMKDTLHPIYEVGFDYMLKLFEEQLRLVRELNVDIKVKDCSDDKRLCVEVEFPKEKYPQFYCYRAKIELDRDMHLPSRVMVWDVVDSKLRLVEDYSYWDIREEG